MLRRSDLRGIVRWMPKWVLLLCFLLFAVPIGLFLRTLTGMVWFFKEVSYEWKELWNLED